MLVRFPIELAEWVRARSDLELRSMTSIIVAAVEAERRRLSGRTPFDEALGALQRAVEAQPDARWRALLDVLAHGDAGVNATKRAISSAPKKAG
jgi:hypothetical protein